MRILKYLVPAALTALACGAPVDGDEFDSGLDLGTAQQALIFPPTGAAQPGIRPVTLDTCIEGDTTQLCVVPHHLKMIYYFTAGTGSQKSVWGSLIQGEATKLRANGLNQCSRPSCWEFREASAFNDPTITTRIFINGGTESMCTGVLDRTRSAYCFDGPTRGLIKRSPLSGTYNTWNGIHNITIDAFEIENASLTPAQKENLRQQVAGAFVLGEMGKGLANIGNNRCNNVFLNPNVTCVSAPAEACFGNGTGGDEDQDGVQELGANCGN